MGKYLLIMAGGAVGSLARHLVHGWAQGLSSALSGPPAARVVFPLGTLLVNVIGCFLMGALGALVLTRFPVREELRLALAVGLLGGFTTFSAFGWETYVLATQRAWPTALANVLLNVSLSLTAVWAGLGVARFLFIAKS